MSAPPVPQWSSLLRDDDVRLRLDRLAGVRRPSLAAWWLVTLALAIAAWELRASHEACVGTALVAWLTMLGAIRAFVVRGRADDALDDLLVWPAKQPVPITGWKDFLVSSEPMFDVELEQPAPVELIDELPAGIAVHPVSPTRFRFECLPDNPSAARAVIEHIVVPLHRSVGVESITMGGAL